MRRSALAALLALFVGTPCLAEVTDVSPAGFTSRTVHAIVAKPIERWEFVLGKYLGMATTLTVLVGLFAAAMVVLLLYQGVGVSGAVVKAVVLAWGEVMVVAAIALFFSAFSTPFLSGIFSLGLFVIGRITPDIQAALGSKEASAGSKTLLRVVLEIVPDLHLYAVSGRTLDGQHVSVNGDFVSWGYVATAGGYGLLWIGGLLALAIVIFQRRDFA